MGCSLRRLQSRSVASFGCGPRAAGQNPGRLCLLPVALRVGAMSLAVNGELLSTEAPLAVAVDSATALLGAQGRALCCPPPASSRQRLR